MPGSRMHDQPGRLVDDDQMLVLVGDAERHGLGARLGGLGLGHLHLVALPGFDPAARLSYCRAGEPHLACADQRLDA